MEKRNYSGLFNPGGCLTAVAFKKYLEGSLRPAEKVRVEDHLRHCLICSEALEGYKRQRNSHVMQNDLEFLTGRIRKRYTSKIKPFQGLPVSILISLFVFFLIILIIYFIIWYLLAA
jgi:hypothetical protein